MLKWWFTRPGRLNEPEGPRVECCERPVLADRVAALQDHMVGVIVNDHGIVKAETRILWSTRGVERRMASPGCECGVVVDSNSPDQFARGHSSRILVTGSAVARGMHQVRYQEQHHRSSSRNSRVGLRAGAPCAPLNLEQSCASLATTAPMTPGYVCRLRERLRQLVGSDWRVGVGCGEAQKPSQHGQRSWQMLNEGTCSIKIRERLHEKENWI